MFTRVRNKELNDILQDLLFGWLVVFLFLFPRFCSNGKPDNAGLTSNDKQGREAEYKIFSKVCKGKK